MRWTDIDEIAMALEECHPAQDPQYVRFTDLHRWVCELKGFEDAPGRSNERILESIQMAWIKEHD